MEFEKQGSSNTSSEENNEELEQVKEELKDRKRCYECTFCKRGFTNAQALGGHMNIHRKDRAKTKHNTCVSSDHQIVAPISTQPISYYPVFQPHKDYYNSYNYLQPSGSGTQSLTTNPQLLGPNLSLRINSTHFDQDSEVVKTEFGNCDQDVDLELRLGHG